MQFLIVYVRSLSRRMALVLCAAFALAVAARAASDDVGLPLIQTYGVRDYNEQSQNWVITQDADGLLYVGNNNGVVLTYDGHKWISIKVAGPSGSVRGLQFDEAGRLWVGATGDLGYLEKDGRGGFSYTSLRDKLPSEVRNNIVMYHLVVRPDGIFFFTFDHVLRWDGVKFDVEKLRRAWPSQAGGRLFRHGEGRPFEEWTGGAWRTLADTPELRQFIVRFATTRPDGSLLLATSRGGFFILRDGVITPWPTECDAFLKTAGIERGLQLRDGSLVLSHRPHGFSILTADGRLRHYFTQENSPIPTSIAWAFFEDRQDNLWVALDAGLVWLGRNDGATYFGQTGGTRQLNSNTICPFHGRIYIGTPNGLYRVESTVTGENPPRQARLVRVPGVDRDVRALYNTDNELLIASPQGVEAWRGDGTPLQPIVTQAHISKLWISRLDPTRAVAGGLEGAYPLIRTADGWRAGAKLPGIDNEIRAFSLDADGSLWLASLNQGFFRLIGLPGTPSADGAPLRIEHYAGGNGLRSDRVGNAPRMATMEGRTRFLDGDRRFHFDSSSRRFVEDFAIDQRLGLPGAELTGFQADIGGHFWATIRRPDASGWPARGRQIFRVEPNGDPSPLPYRVLDYAGAGLAMQPMKDADGRDVLWLAGSDGLVRMDLARALQPPALFHVRIVRAADNTNQALRLGESARLGFDRRTLTLRVATDRLGDPNLRYQSRLNAEPWSEWTEQPLHTFDRLPVGKQTLEIRARDSDGVVTAPVLFSVMVQPPWWFTWWAWLGYAVLLAAGFAGLVRWRLRVIEQRNAELAALVEVRTAELNSSKENLREALMDADAANRAKSVFLASMSHELRTPLNAILGYTQILRQLNGLGAEQRRQIDTVHASGEHLLHLINEVLDLAKIEAGKVDLRLQPMSLSRLLAHLTEIFEPRAAQKSIAYALHSELALRDHVLADEGRLRQVLYNLLGNAVKFTARGQVELRVTATEGRVRFTVTDTGPGIAPAEQAAIFGLFHQAVGPALSAEGAGLGLAISQRLVRLMGGEITVESALGEGSRFSFEIDLPPAPVADAATVDALPSGYRGLRRRVLVVDDEAVNRDVLRALLEPRGFEVTMAERGEDALALVAADVPDVVLMDLRLKGIDGFETTRRIRALTGVAAAVRIVAISASVFPIDRHDAIAAGCDEFEPKPIRAATLLNVIGRLLGIDWEWPVVPVGESSLPNVQILPDNWPLPPLAVLNVLDDHADLGDVAALRDELQRARDAHPAAEAFLRTLDGFSARAELGALRQWIARAIDRTETSPP